jgi:predicted amidohydrolase YtcJ
MTGSHGPGEFVLANAVVHTMDRARPLADALAVRDGRILAVGSDDIERSGIAASVPTIDLGGAVVLPGFIDAHTHVEFIALSRHFWVDVRGLSEARDIVARLREREAELGPGEWLVGQGTFGQGGARLRLPRPAGRGALDHAQVRREPGRPRCERDR